MADRARDVQYANVDRNAVGSASLVAGMQGMSIILINANFIAYGAVTVSLEDGGGISRIGPWSFAANGGISMPDSEVGWARFGSGQSLNMRLGASVRVAGSIAYRLVPDHFGF